MAGSDPAGGGGSRPRVRLTERAVLLSERLRLGRGTGEFVAPCRGLGGGRRDELARGTTIGPYRVLRAIGRGGMSIVYEARHAAGHRAALKVAKHDEPGDPQCRERLLLEALVLGDLQHPATTELYDVGALADGRPWVAMELLDGESLSERLARAPFELAEACALLATVVDALGAAHAVGVVHRDLKPDNVVLQRAASPPCKVIDWGIARASALPDARITEVGIVSGTPLYMAPEQARGREVDGACDVYALGVIAYEIACGAPPFDAPTSVDLLLQHINVAPRDPRELAPALPAWLAELVLAMLAKEPAARPGVRAIRAALSQGFEPVHELEDVLAELERADAAVPRLATAFARHRT